VSGPGESAQASPPKDGRDVLSWALAVSPLAVTVFLAVLVLLDLTSAFRWIFVVSLVAFAALVIADKKRLLWLDVSSKGRLPATAWFLIPPAYLWRRATCLGRSRGQFWVWMACAVLAFIIRVAFLATLASSLSESGGLPGYASQDVVDDMMNLFDDLPVVRGGGLKGVSLSDWEEASQGSSGDPTQRRCTGMMLASNDREYAIVYTFEQREEQVIIHLQLQLPP